MRTLQSMHKLQQPIDQAEERISEVEDQLNEIKRETKIRGTKRKKNEQSLQEMWDYVKRMNPSWKILFRLLFRKISPTSQGRPIFKSRKYREHQKDIPQEEKPQGT